MSLLRKITVGIVLLLGVMVAGTCIASRTMGANQPKGGVTGPEADALARRIESAVAVDAWHRTGAVQWTFRGKHSHLWDRRRMLHRIVQGDDTVLIDLGTRRGIVTQGGRTLTGAERDSALEKAWATWANDSFWLNPLAKLLDDGVTRTKVSLPDDPDGAEGLLVSYSKGGVTPGDAYLWIVDANGVPKAWRMWTSVFPVQGIRVSWEGWQTLATGAKVSTRHALPGLSLELGDVAGAETLEALTGGSDPFAPLLAGTESQGGR